MPSIPHDLAAFLVEAKRRTYAGLDDDATLVTPLLPGSRILWPESSTARPGFSPVAPRIPLRSIRATCGRLE